MLKMKKKPAAFGMNEGGKEMTCNILYEGNPSLHIVCVFERKYDYSCFIRFLQHTYKIVVCTLTSSEELKLYAVKDIFKRRSTIHNVVSL